MKKRTVLIAMLALDVVVLSTVAACASTEREMVRTINDHNTEGRAMYSVNEDGTLYFVECWDGAKYIGVYRSNRTSELYGPVDICTGIDGRPARKKDLRAAGWLIEDTRDRDSTPTPIEESFPEETVEEAPEVVVEEPAANVDVEGETQDTEEPSRSRNRHGRR